MASAEQIRRAMEAEGRRTTSSTARRPSSTWPTTAARRRPAAPRTDADDESEPAVVGWAEERLRAVMGAAVDEWLSIADWDYQRWKEFYSSRTILHQIPRTPLLFEVCIELVCSPGNDQKTLQRGAAGLFALYTFYKTQTGRQQKAVMDIDQFEWFFALQDAARGAPGHRGAHDVQVIFKMLFDDQGVDVAAPPRAARSRGSAPGPRVAVAQMQPGPPGSPKSGGESQYDAVRPGDEVMRAKGIPRCAERPPPAPTSARATTAPRPPRRSSRRRRRAGARAGAGAAPGRYDRLMALDDLGEASDEDMAPPPPPRRPPPPIRAPRPSAMRTRRASSPPCGRTLAAGGDATAAARAVLDAARPRPPPPIAPRQRAPAAAGHDERVRRRRGPERGRRGRLRRWHRLRRQLRDRRQLRPPMMAPPAAGAHGPTATTTRRRRRTAGPDNGLQQLRDLLAASDDDDDDSCAGDPGTTI